MNWGWKWFVDFNAEKIPFDRSNNTYAIDVKMDVSSFKVLE